MPLGRRPLIFATLLAAISGYVDAIGFLMTGGYFVSFMSGNTTRLGVGLAVGSKEAILAASLIAAFVFGVIVGASVRRLTPTRPEAFILALLTGALAGSAGLLYAGHQLPAALLLAAAMGSENTIFAEAGEVRVGLTYMTGALVKVGKGVTASLFGEARLRWVPHLLLWLGLISGAVLGAIAFRALHELALWIAVASTSLLALLSPKIFPLTSLSEIAPTAEREG